MLLVASLDISAHQSNTAKHLRARVAQNNEQYKYNTGVFGRRAQPTALHATDGELSRARLQKDLGKVQELVGK